MKTANKIYILLIFIIVSCSKDNPVNPLPKKDITVSINIEDKQKNVNIDPTVVIDFSDKVYSLQGEKLEDSKIKEFIDIKEESANGAILSFDAKWSNESKRITIKLSDLKYNSDYTLKIDGSKLKGENGEKVDSKDISFSTAKTPADAIIKVSFNIAENEKVGTNQDLIITFDQVVMLKDGKTINKDKLKEFISLKSGNSEVSYTANISDGAKKITLDIVLSYNSDYTLKIDGDKLKGENGQSVEIKTLNFTTLENTFVNIKDPLYKDQWHLKNTTYASVNLKDGGQTKIDINVESVWKQGYTGKGIKIGIWDSQIEHTHPDLKDNITPENIMNNFSADGICINQESDTHGTNVAGIIASRDNNIGTIGVAYRSTLYSYAVISPPWKSVDVKWNHVEEMLKSFNRSEKYQIAVYNGSLIDGGSSEHTYQINSSERQVLNNFDRLTRDGFGGLGASLVFAAGNGSGMFGTPSNNDFMNHYAVIGVNAISADGDIIESKGIRQQFSTSSVGPNIWLVAPSSARFQANARLTTTDLVGSCGYKGNYTRSFGATSGAAPQVTGVIALLREAYPNFTWRDVKLILAESAKKIAIDPNHDLPWKVTGKMYSNSSKNQEYQRAMGFGLVDAGAAFELAKTWTVLPSMKTEIFENFISLNTQTKDVIHSSDLNVQNSQINFIEYVVVDLEMEKTTLLKLFKWTLYLESPDGKVAWIYKELENYHEVLNVVQSITKFSFAVNSFLGSSVVNGNWKLKIQIKNTDKDKNMKNEGELKNIKNWKITVRGH